jgi:hypothetical protein
MIIKETKYSFCDLEIVPARTTSIESRKECNITYENGKLPLFTAPMDSVVDDTNYKIFQNAGINTIVHRNVKLEKRIELTLKEEWCAYSQNEFRELFCQDVSPVYDKAKKDSVLHVLMDFANGHRLSIFTDAVKSKKIAAEKGIKLILMAGNIANPKTYVDYCKAGIDYVRCTIGRGNCCLTSANVSTGYANASLIEEIFNIKKQLIFFIEDVKLSYKKYKKYNKIDTYFYDMHLFGDDIYDYIENKQYVQTKIIADGGIKNYSDAIIALACGADYVMIGSIFASFVESCSDFIKINVDAVQSDLYNNIIYKSYTKSLKKFDNINIYENIGFQEKIDDKNGETYLFAISKKFSEEDVYDDYMKLSVKYNLADPYDFDNGYYTITGNHNIMVISLKKEQIYENEEVGRWLIKHCYLEKSAHGMSTKAAQIGYIKSKGQKVDKSKLKTSEGKTLTMPVEYTVNQWTENFSDYLRSALSYNDNRNIYDFIGNCTLVVKSYGTMNTVNK